MSDRTALLAFCASLAALSAVYGIFAERQGWFPAPQLRLAEHAVNDWSAYWENDLGLAPTRHLVEARRKDRRSGDPDFVVHRPGAAAPGQVLVTGLDPRPEGATHAALLLDAEGRTLHAWPVRYRDLDPDGPKPLNVMLHGMEVFADGSLAVTFDAGDVLARIDACGRPIWTADGPFHHSIKADDHGGLWTWRDLEIVRLDAETGEVTHELDLTTRIMEAGDGQHGVFAIRAYTDDIDGWRYGDDPFHANDVEPLGEEMAAAFPLFQAGDLLISLRELNLLAVVEPTEGRLRWYRHGPWHKQHDPDFEPDGTITVFDNGTGSGRSRLLRTRPGSAEVETVFEGRDDAPFYTWRRGKHEMLPGGGALVTESERGRVFEIDRDGDLLWDWEARFDADRNVIITEARKIPPGFFTDGIPRCMGDNAARPTTADARTPGQALRPEAAAAPALHPNAAPRIAGGRSD